MILLTVGMQLPFDRLIMAVDEIAPTLAMPVFAQTGLGKYQPRNIEWRASIDPVEFKTYLDRAEVIVAHAGIGTVLNAQKIGKPIIIMPRVAALGEHRNDHQLATAKQLEGRDGIHVARSAEELAALLRAGVRGPDPAAAPNPARERLRSYIADVIQPR